MSLTRMISVVGPYGYQTIDVMCWPPDEHEWGGLTHLVIENLDKNLNVIQTALDAAGMTISSLQYHSNPLHPDQTQAEQSIKHTRLVIEAAKTLSVPLVSFRCGMDYNLSLDANFELAEALWTPLIKFAADSGIKIAFDACPATFCNGPVRGSNLLRTPAMWQRFFELMRSDDIGLDFNPSYLVGQFIDPMRPLYQFCHRILHFQAQDIRINKAKLDWHGSTTTYDDYIDQATIGSGDINWKDVIGALSSVGYDGTVSAFIQRWMDLEQMKLVTRMAGNMLRHTIDQA